MISKSWSRKSIATAVAVAVLSVYSMAVLAAPGGKASGEVAVDLYAPQSTIGATLCC